MGFSGIVNAIKALLVIQNQTEALKEGVRVLQAKTDSHFERIVRLETELRILAEVLRAPIRTKIDSRMREFSQGDAGERPKAGLPSEGE